MAGVSIGQWLGFVLETLPDKNFTTVYKLFVFGVAPRALILIALAAIFTMLCKRTAGMLSNLLGAEEQEKLMSDMKLMQEQSKKTSQTLISMVKELSAVSETSAAANEQIAEETGRVLLNFSTNTSEIDGMNESTQDINIQLIALDEQNSQVAKLAEQVNEKTKENRVKMDFAVQSMEQTKAAVENIGIIIREVVGNTEKAVRVMENSAELTKKGKQGIEDVGKSTTIITSSNRKMSEQIVEMEKTTELIREKSSRMASGMQQINQSTQGNYSAIEHVTAATQENSAGIAEIDKMVARIRTLAKQLQDGLAM